MRRRGKTGGTPEWFPEAKEVEQEPEGVKSREVVTNSRCAKLSVEQMRAEATSH